MACDIVTPAILCPSVLFERMLLLQLCTSYDDDGGDDKRDKAESEQYNQLPIFAPLVQNERQGREQLLS